MNLDAKAAQKAAQWILSEQLPDGSFTPTDIGVDAYNKIPYALNITGHSVEANRLLDWIKKTTLLPTVTFAGRLEKVRSLFTLSFLCIPTAGHSRRPTKWAGSMSHGEACCFF